MSSKILKTARTTANKMRTQTLGKSSPERNRPLKDEIEAVLASLKRLGNNKTRDDMLPRYGIVSNKAFGVPMAAMLKLAKGLGRSHELAAGLWETGWYEARMVASLVDEPERVTPAQMDRWCRDFDNWGICDTVCFKLFDRVPQAFGKVEQWSRRRDEFVKRAARSVHFDSVRVTDRIQASARV